MKIYYVYILASGKKGTLYVGMTNDLVRRTYEHRNGLVKGFTKTYGVKKLVHFEVTSDVQVALQRERSLKRWRRDWKIALIEKSNPDWRDLFDDVAR